MGDFSLKNKPRSGRPSGVSDEVLPSMIRANPTFISTEVGFKIGIPPTTVLDYIKCLVPCPYSLFGCQTYKAKKEIEGQSFDICSSNFARHKERCHF
ncbi:hypothetical protein TNCV_844491 [Trichonephila clavipes]|uniref:Uncharacterized protein n=1 Tax=Trichonephila clavipes TaxID=2585209 RepID=A0A8X6WH90_TRICX|nr:hypothetical protein TNCV_844491 [Trichonephila clavipes]